MNSRATGSAGVVLFRRRESILECLLVRSRGGRWGFPKGRRLHEEPLVANAVRELEEETGIASECFALIETVFADERTKVGLIAVRYFAALLTREAPLDFYDDENVAVEWVAVSDALQKFGSVRAALLENLARRISPATTSQRG